MAWILASTIGAAATRILVACALLALAVLVLALGLWLYRRRWLGTTDSAATGWTLEELRKLRSQGDLTEPEYQALRATLLGSFAEKAAKPETGRTLPGGIGSGPPSDPF